MKKSQPLEIWLWERLQGACQSQSPTRQTLFEENSKFWHLLIQQEKKPA
jgi:hypothetical protein